MASNRNAWVSYLRVSTAEQAEKDLSIPAQRESVAAYAKRFGKVIDREYLEPGRSGTDLNRKAFQEMLENVLKPGSEIGVIIVHHTSRFTRNATQARVVKEKLRRKGVKVISVSQDLNDDPMGQLIEGIFECIDQYESELNGMRTSAAMREAVRQGYFPGSSPPYGFGITKVEVKPGLFRSVLTVAEDEASFVRELFQLYVAGSGAKGVARALNQREHWYRGGKMWSKDLVLKVLDESAASGTYWWGKHDSKTRRKKDRSEWLPLSVEPIVEKQLFDLARQLRSEREPTRNPGRSASQENLLKGLVRCGKCGASYTLEMSGKRKGGELYKYRYYNCRTACRVGKEACSGKRIPTKKLDALVLEYLSTVVCTDRRCEALIRQIKDSDYKQRRARQLEQLNVALKDVEDRISSWKSVLARKKELKEPGRTRLSKLKHHKHEIDEQIQEIENEAPSLPKVDTEEAILSRIKENWSAIIRCGDTVARNYLHQIIDRIEVDENEITVIPKETFMAAS
ncbi:MAG: recombinase family protein [Proteobacteria bacterium]|nr:recombinase family protein [Pseudomonadota bacterium]